MKKSTFFLVVLVACVLMGCVRVSKSNGQVEKDLPIEAFYKDFIKDYPNYNANDATRQEAFDAFVVAVKDTIDKCNIFEGVPVKLQTVNKIKDGTYVAQFQSWINPNGFDYRHGIYKVCFDVIGVVPDSIVPQLKDDEYYTFEGNYISNVEFHVMEALLGRETIGITASFGVEQDYIFEDKVSLHFAYMYYDFTSIKPFVGRECE